MGLGYEIRDQGSGKNLFRIPDPGVKKAPDPGSGSATLLPRFNIERRIYLFRESQEKNLRPISLTIVPLL
jgi:hypothetical protein